MDSNSPLKSALAGFRAASALFCFALVSAFPAGLNGQTAVFAGAQTTLASSLTDPKGIAVDAKGNVIPSLVIPAGQTVTLSPGGTHINIIGMRYKVDDGAVVPCAVSFTNNGDVGAYLNAVREPAQN